MGDWLWRDGRWLHDPQAATPVTAADYDPSATRVGIPAVGGRITYAGSVDYAHVPSDDALGGDLGTVTDAEWRAAHERLIADLPDPDGHLAYTWTPGVPAARVDGPDMAPADGEYDPNADERFDGGGFRG